MEIFIFDNVTNKLRINEYDILLIKEFADLWDQNRNKCAEDKTGEKRLLAYKEFTYIYLTLDFKSPYFKYLERDKHEAALADSGLEESHLKDPLFVAAYHKYQEIQEADPVLSLIKTAYHTLYKTQVFLDSIDYSERDDSGKPIYKPKDVMNDIATIGSLRTKLQELEVLHKTNMAAASKVRGDIQTGFMEDSYAWQK